MGKMSVVKLSSVPPPLASASASSASAPVPLSSPHPLAPCLFCKNILGLIGTVMWQQVNSLHDIPESRAHQHKDSATSATLVPTGVVVPLLLLLLSETSQFISKLSCNVCVRSSGLRSNILNEGIFAIMPHRLWYVSSLIIAKSTKMV